MPYDDLIMNIENFDRLWHRPDIHPLDRFPDLESDPERREWLEEFVNRTFENQMDAYLAMFDPERIQIH